MIIPEGRARIHTASSEMASDWRALLLLLQKRHGRGDCVISGIDVVVGEGA